MDGAMPKIPRNENYQKWLPMRPNAVDIGLYQELTEGGI